ncbi:MAG: nickel pincer cofactor biosynthesis protein LarB [Cyanobacteria bacterium P01_H01_bin.130]
MTAPEQLRQLLEAIAQGAVSPDAAYDQLKTLQFEAIDDFAKVDHQRAMRTGFPEVIWGPGKTPEQIAQIMTAMGDRAQTIMVTRLEEDAYAALQTLIPNLQYFSRARIAAVRSPEALYQPIHPGQIGVLSAGTADLPVADEAAVTAELMGFNVKRLWDVGVAGIHRLLAHRDQIVACDVVIVVAGMEGALPSVVAGMVNSPVIAVPTSIGYGAHFNGLAALLSMLNSCATGIGVVNIDNGFGAAMLAGQILRTAKRISDRP